MFEQDTRGLKGLLPTVQAALAAHGGEVEPGFATYLRAARVREELRSEIVRRLCGEVLHALAAQGIEAIALKGCFLAEAVYEEPAMRHNHGIDVLVREHDLERAGSAAAALGFSTAAGVRWDPRQWLRFTHASGLPLEVHSRLFAPDHWRVSLPALWERSRPDRVAGAPARALSPADNLLHVCGFAASHESRAGLRWAVDAWRIIDRFRELDWEGLVATSEESRLSLPMYVLVRYLADEMEAAVPAQAVRSLARSASKASARDREATLLGATRTLAALGAAVAAAGGARGRANVVRTVLLPSPAWMRERYDRAPAWILPALYVHRLGRHAAIRLAAARVRRTPQRG